MTRALDSCRDCGGVYEISPHATGQCPSCEDSEARHYVALAKECRCCSDCWSLPCEGCAAGGVCDQICNCDDDDVSGPAALDDDDEPAWSEP